MARKKGKKSKGANRKALLSNSLRQREKLTHQLTLITSAFCSGGAIMIIELAAIRIIAPWFGNSLYTWAGLIGVILTAMSVGYYFGGWLADRRPSYITLAHLLIISAGFVFIIPTLERAMDNFFGGLDIISGPVFATLIIFAFPSCLLGSVPPFTVRLISLLSDDEKVGLSAGTVGMFSTLGSVIGTFFAGFFLIPRMKLDGVFICTGVLLICLSFLNYWLFLKTWKEKVRTFLLVGLFLSIPTLLLVSSGTRIPKDVVFQKTTFYHRIRVVESEHSSGDKIRQLYLDSTLEGAQFQNLREIPISYQHYWELARAFCREIKTGAFLGGGAFTMPEFLLHAYPEAEVDVIEIDPKVVEVGRMFFRVDEYKRLNPIVGDARRHLYLTDKKYDFIFGDAYNGVRNIPAHLVTVEFFNLVKERLTENGIYLMNIISSITGRNSELFCGIVKSLRYVFGDVYVFAVASRRLDTVQNLIIMTCPNAIDLDKAIHVLDNTTDKKVLSLLNTYVPSNQYDTSNSPLFTDNYNPVEYIVAKNIGS